MGKIKVTLENWVGKVSFEVSQEKINTFNDYWEGEGMVYDEEEDILNKENDFTLNISSFYFDPYLELEPDGEFVCITEHYISHGDTEGIGFAFEFENCEPSNEFTKYLFDNEWLFFDTKNAKIIKDVKTNEKLLVATTEGDCEIENSGCGVIRFRDFNFREWVK